MADTAVFDNPTPSRCQPAGREPVDFRGMSFCDIRLLFPISLVRCRPRLVATARLGAQPIAGYRKERHPPPAQPPPPSRGIPTRRKSDVQLVAASRRMGRGIPLAACTDRDGYPSCRSWFGSCGGGERLKKPGGKQRHGAGPRRYIRRRRNRGASRARGRGRISCYHTSLSRAGVRARRWGPRRPWGPRNI